MKNNLTPKNQTKKEKEKKVHVSKDVISRYLSDVDNFVYLTIHMDYLLAYHMACRIVSLCIVLNNCISYHIVYRKIHELHEIGKQSGIKILLLLYKHMHKFDQQTVNIKEICQKKVIEGIAKFKHIDK